VDRFWSKVDKTPGLGPNGDCWEWIAYRNKDGYGEFKYEGEMIKAHRMVWFLQHNEWPKKDRINHICCNPCCVRIDHLEDATHKEDSDYRVKLDRQAKGTQSGNSKLSEDQVDKIRTSPLSYRSIGKMYGISNSQVSKIKNRQHWRHL
jgi:hypothetical protein